MNYKNATQNQSLGNSKKKIQANFKTCIIFFLIAKYLVQETSSTIQQVSKIVGPVHM